MPAVSVIVPNYNHARFLRRRIDTILGQTFKDFELILLDDCSTDDSRTILKHYAASPCVRIEFNEVNSGSAFKQWNKGVRLATGKYVWIAESDDYADPQFLERLVPILESDPEVMLAYSRSYCVSRDDRLLGFADSLYFSGFDPEHWDANFCVDGHEECRTRLVRYNTVPNASAVLFRKEIWDRVGGADDSMCLCGDWKVWVSMALEGKIAYVSEPLSYYRLHDTSVTSTVNFASVHVREWLKMTRWMLAHVTPATDVLEKVYENHAHRWVPALLSFRVPLDVKLAILHDVRAVDPHPVRRITRPVLATIQRKILRHWRELRAMVVPTRS
jgi:glycosyltransferase involved in cell wall biosynthesis